MNLINAHHCAVVFIDYQERLMPVIHNGPQVLQFAGLLAQAAGMLDIDILGTEQNPARMGPNAPIIKAGSRHTLAKMHFDACAGGLPALLDNLENRGQEVVIAGCEAHICLLQTALRLLETGRRLWVVADASGSRRPEDHALAMNRLAQAGANIVNHEMVLFEWLGGCEHPRFRDVLALVKNTVRPAGAS